MDQPVVGLGTLGLKESAEAALGKAAECSCILVDTGEHYGNLDVVGAGLKKFTDKKPFVVVKLSGMPTGEYAVVEARMRAMLEKLGVESAGLCLMHWPGLCAWDPTDMGPLASPGDFQSCVSSWGDFCANIASAWANMRRLKEDGLCGEIGTSNFYPQHLQELAKAYEGAMPYANEIFIDLSNPETEFVDAMQRQGIRVLAYRPVAYKPHPEPAKRLAERLGNGASPQSVVLAWLLHRGVYPLVKCRGEHVAENLQLPASIKDALTAEDMEELRGCETDFKFSPEWFAKIWRSHGQEKPAFTDEDVAMLTGMGVDEAKARAALEQAGGDLDAAMDIAFAG